MHMQLRETHQVGERTREWLIGPDAAPLLATHGIFLAGWSEAHLGFRFVRPQYPRAQVLACRAGRGEAWVEGVWRPVEAGSAYITPAGATALYRALPGIVWEVVWVTYREAGPVGGEVRILCADPEPLYTVVRGLHVEAHGEADPEAMADWSRLVAMHARRLGAPEGVHGDPRLRRLWSAILSDPAHSWSLAEMARQARVSGEHLRRLCQKEQGCGPMEHVTRLRMQHAAALLSSGRYSVASVAERVGYDNPFAFSTAFKRHQSVPPSHFRTGAPLPEKREG